MTKKLLNILEKSEKELFVIHYSCQSLNDSNEGYSPRITSVVVQNVKTDIAHSFSIHLEAEIKKIDKKDIEQKYDELEFSMIDNLYSFMRENANANYLHWNMTNITYGFETIEHRYKFLNGDKEKIPSIPDQNRFNLSSIILGIYGSKCVGHPRMEKLMEKNGEVPQDFLNGEEESKSFKNKEYVKLHKSTLAKVGWFAYFFKLIKKRKVKVEKNNWDNKIRNFFDSNIYKVVGGIATIITIVGGILWLIKK